MWNLKTGQLLKRHNDAIERRLTDDLPDGLDVTSMAYVQNLNAYICMKAIMLVWAFPTNDRQRQMTQSIQRRERKIKAMLASTFSDGEDESNEDY